MLSLRAIFECQHFCPTPAVPLRYFLNTAFVRRGAMMRSGLYLVRPDSCAGNLWEGFLFFLNNFFMSSPPLSPFACCLNVCFSHSSTWTVMWSLLFLHRRIVPDFEFTAAWILARHGRQAHFLFLFVSHMVYFYICLSLSPTNTDTYINTHTHSRICTRTHFPIYWKKTQTLVYSASQSFEVPLFFFRFTVLCSHMRLTDKSETPANTVSSDLNVAILQSHFQLCFSGFIRGEIVLQLP